MPPSPPWLAGSQGRAVRALRLWVGVVARSADGALAALGALEAGVDGVWLCSDAPAEVSARHTMQAHKLGRASLGFGVEEMGLGCLGLGCAGEGTALALRGKAVGSSRQAMTRH
jgi:hypothetical protein